VQEGTRGDWQPEFSTTEAAAVEKTLDNHIDRLGWRDEGWGGKTWEARSTEVGMVHVRCTVKSGRWKCELGRTCDARSTDCECRRKIKVEYRPVSSICRSSVHAGGHRRHGPSEARCRGHTRSIRARLRGRGSKSTDDAEGQRLAECQWKGDPRAGRRCKSESEGVQAPGRTCNVQWSRSEQLEFRRSASVSAGSWETGSGSVAMRIEN
jgi:hypothetical protein